MSTLALRLFLQPWIQNLDSSFSSRSISGGGDTWPNQQHIDTAAGDGKLVMMPIRGRLERTATVDDFSLHSYHSLLIKAIWMLRPGFAITK